MNDFLGGAVKRIRYRVSERLKHSDSKDPSVSSLLLEHNKGCANHPTSSESRHVMSWPEPGLWSFTDSERNSSHQRIVDQYLPLDSIRLPIDSHESLSGNSADKSKLNQLDNTETLIFQRMLAPIATALRSHPNTLKLQLNTNATPTTTAADKCSLASYTRRGGAGPSVRPPAAQQQRCPSVPTAALPERALPHPPHALPATQPNIGPHSRTPLRRQRRRSPATSDMLSTTLST